MTTYPPAEAAEIVAMAATAGLTLAKTARLFSDGLTPVDVARLLGQTRRLTMLRRALGTRPPPADDVTLEEEL